MGKIHVLDKQIAELIAAGEVVERPSSVIKELVENSLDAGANLITVEIQHGGITYIRVSDNGCGIAAEDVPLVFKRHATSKIRSEEDLNAIATLGFRGEAMASIAAVSRVEMLTRTADSEEGTMYVIHGGEEQEQYPVGCPVGTTLIARDLFYNTPARMKFLKKDVSEANSVAVVVEKAALSHPEVSFKFIRDGQVKLHTPGDGKLLSAIHAVLGREAAASMIPVNYEAFGMKVSGYTCKPVDSRSNRTMQNFFINGRFVRSKTMMAALEEAYRHSIMVGKFPSCVLDLQAPFGDTDVNVHPAKIEVRFANEKSAFDVIYYGVKSALSQYDYSLNLNKEEEKPAPTVIGKSPDLNKKAPLRVSAEEYRNLITKEQKAEKSAVQKEIPSATDSFKKQYTENIHSYTKAQKSTFDQVLLNMNKTVSNSKVSARPSTALTLHDDGVPYVSEPKITASNKKTPMTDLEQRASMWDEDLPDCMNGVASPEVKQPKETEKPQVLRYADEEKDPYESARIIGELFGTYILLENKDQLILVDKHAAHERLLFEQLKKLDLTKDRQILLAPVLVHLSREDYAAVADRMDAFQQIGFEVENFEGGDLLVREVPLALPDSDIRSIVEETAHKLLQNRNDLTPEIIDDLLHNIACRSAVKAHDKNSGMELQQIITMLRNNEDVKYCPHGRPIARLLSRREIEKMFGRIQ
ncbi:MAG: DNA mismatch repair endonuclease MutL [Ruminococcaceae bacterium]|nr:DNA mismatch repair endonuclease MutL [Oscillospiraceae bacterium]